MFPAGLARFMEQATTTPLKKSPLHARHRSSGAKMVGFSGWEMPIEYSGISAEHLAVRTRAGLFDVSHMGEIEIAGRDALAAVQRVSINDAARLQVGQAQYPRSCRPMARSSTISRLSSGGGAFPAGRQCRKHPEGLRMDRRAHRAGWRCRRRQCQLALRAAGAAGTRCHRPVLQPLIGVDLSALRYYRFAHGEVAGVRATVSRTGYTGEDGFEIFVPPPSADRVWQAMLQAGQEAGVMPCGLGARDTLRLEAAMRLYGNDIDDTTTPLEAGLGWIVGWQKGGFDHTIGAHALREQKAAGCRRADGWIRSASTPASRAGTRRVHGAGTQVGTVTSGTQTPYLKKAIGMAYVCRRRTRRRHGVRHRHPRTRGARAKVVPMPFYKKRTKDVRTSS